MRPGVPTRPQSAGRSQGSSAEDPPSEARELAARERRLADITQIGDVFMEQNMMQQWRLGGMLDVEARVMRNPPWEQFEAQKTKVIQFGEMWSRFDFTKAFKQKKKRDDSSSDSDSD